MKSIKENSKTLLLIVGGIISVIVCCFIWIQTTANIAIGYEEKVSKTLSDINVQEKRRIDLVYNLADCVKNYDQHEAETLKEIAETRSNTDEIENVNTMIKATAEAYPDLKADKNYQQFMTELSTTENLIAQHRKNHNSSVESYNRYVKKFPQRFFLSLVGYEKKEFKYLEYSASSDAPQDLFGE